MRVNSFYIILITAFAIYFVALLIIASKTKNPIKTLTSGAFSGVAALGLVDVLSVFTGVFIPINVWTVASSAAFGMPGVISLLIINKIIL